MTAHSRRQGSDVDKQAAWLMAAFGEDREYKGNTGYEDEFGVVYRYDSFVPNHKRVQAGDLAFLHSRTEFLGVARIERVEVVAGTKTRLTCPKCGKGAVFPRTRKLPVWRCKKCREEFPEPKVGKEPCDLYAARFGGTVISNRVDLPLKDVKAAVLIGLPDGLDPRTRV
jgi:putative restriction endonuclease